MDDKETEGCNPASKKKLKTNKKGKTKIEIKRNDDVYENVGEVNHRQVASQVSLTCLINIRPTVEYIPFS